MLDRRYWTLDTYNQLLLEVATFFAKLSFNLSYNLGEPPPPKKKIS